MKDDSLNLFLSYMCNMSDTTTERARKVRKCAKAICRRNNDKGFKNALRIISNHKNDSAVLVALDKAVNNYFLNVRG